MKNSKKNQLGFTLTELCIVIWGLLCLVFGLGITAFVIWAVYRLVTHFT